MGGGPQHAGEAVGKLVHGLLAQLAGGLGARLLLRRRVPPLRRGAPSLPGQRLAFAKTGGRLPHGRRRGGAPAFGCSRL